METLQQVNVILPSGKTTGVSYGTRVKEILTDTEFENLTFPIVGALVNNEVASLTFKIEVNASIQPVTLDTTEGARIYRRSLCFVLAIAARQLYPDKRLIVGHSLGDGYYYYFDNDTQVDVADLQALEKQMRDLVKQNLPIQRRVLSYCDALEHLQSTGHESASQLLEHRSESKIPIYECCGFKDISHGPLVPETGILRFFEIMPYPGGFLLRYPSVEEPEKVRAFEDHPVVFSVFQEYKQWGSILGISSAGQLNALIRADEIEDFIRVAEALHDKKIAEIADRISDRSKDVRLVLIAGPSSSGKTTFTKKLTIQLKVNGFNPVTVSTDNYFLPRELTPRDENGEYDFESIEAIDLERFNENMLGLLEGREEEIPVFDFKTGRNKAHGVRLKLGDRNIILIEGIHGLNDRLTHLISNEKKFKIYISALTQLNIDDQNRIPTTDVRLIRRLVRDNQFRGYSALETLERWPSVRRGENKYIFPFDNNADVAFNSALDYELPVLKAHAEPLLRTVKPFEEAYNEAIRLSRFLDNFIMIPSNYVPSYSILREFIGGSGFRY